MPTVTGLSIRWDCSQNLPLPQQPILYSKRIQIDDSQGGNGNGYIEQGERIRLVVPVFNSGTTITNVSGVLRTDSPGIELRDTTAEFGTIVQFDGTDNAAQPFVLDILPTAEAGGPTGACPGS